MKSEIGQQYGQTLTHKAIASGELKRPDACELCGVKGKYKMVRGQWGEDEHQRYTLNAHHWNGYGNYLDVWFICTKCNLALAQCHNGSLNKAQAREIVKIKNYVRRVKVLSHLVPGYKLRGPTRFIKLDVSGDVARIKSLAD